MTPTRLAISDNYGRGDHAYCTKCCLQSAKTPLPADHPLSNTHLPSIPTKPWLDTNASLLIFSLSHFMLFASLSSWQTASHDNERQSGSSQLLNHNSRSKHQSGVHMFRAISRSLSPKLFNWETGIRGMRERAFGYT